MPANERTLPQTLLLICRRRKEMFDVVRFFMYIMVMNAEASFQWQHRRPIPIRCRDFVRIAGVRKTPPGRALALMIWSHSSVNIIVATGI